MNLDSLTKSAENELQVFSGVVNQYTMNVMNIGESWIISRFYGKLPKIKVSWGFNKMGRIKFVNLRATHQVVSPFTPIIRVRSPGILAWEEAEADLYELPIEVMLINNQLLYMPKVQRYQSIIRYGHSMSRELLSEISECNQGIALDLREQAGNNTQILQRGNRISPLAELAKERDILNTFNSAGSLFLTEARHLHYLGNPDSLLKSVANLVYAPYIPIS